MWLVQCAPHIFPPKTCEILHTKKNIVTYHIFIFKIQLKTMVHSTPYFYYGESTLPWHAVYKNVYF